MTRFIRTGGSVHSVTPVEFPNAFEANIDPVVGLCVRVHQIIGDNIGVGMGPASVYLSWSSWRSFHVSIGQAGLAEDGEVIDLECV